jgi:rod shape-determining protein MreB
MLGRTPDGVLAVRPMKDGVIADFDVTEKMLRYFLTLIIENHVFKVKPRVIVCVPSGITEVEKRAVRDSALGAGAKEVFMVAEPMAAAIGVGLPGDADGNMVIDIGGGTTEIAVIALSGIVSDTSIAPAAMSSTRRSCNSCARTTTCLSASPRLSRSRSTLAPRLRLVRARDGREGTRSRLGIPKTVRALERFAKRFRTHPADRRRGPSRARDHAARAREHIVDRASS